MWIAAQFHRPPHRTGPTFPRFYIFSIKQNINTKYSYPVIPLHLVSCSSSPQPSYAGRCGTRLNAMSAKSSPCPFALPLDPLTASRVAFNIACKLQTATDMSHHMAVFFFSLFAGCTPLCQSNNYSTTHHTVASSSALRTMRICRI